MFSFGNPEYLYLLLLLPVIVALYWLARRARSKNLKIFGQRIVADELMPDVSKYKPWIKLTLELVIVALIIVILARPRAGSKTEVTKVRGIEVMLCVDVSNSMLASSTDDPKGVSRMQRTKLVMERVIDKLRDDKIGLIVFAGNAYTQMPITTDGVSAKMFLNEISTNMVPTQGTAIGAAIKLAMNSFTDNDKSQKAIIVITDGENHEDDAVAMAKSAKEKGIQVNVVGVGTVKGSQIPIGGGQLMKDDNGNVVTTRLNEQMAQDIATAGGGVYVPGNASDAVSTLNDQLQKLAKSDLKSVVYSQHNEQFPVFAWLALLFVVINVFVDESKNSWLRKYNFFTKDNKNEKDK
ncbi:MAG: VWA domain-containing protein [Muribaculaceae bacterium]|nr:VWA domain-containing protein [Muribaculaceae bacterium]MEE1298681.1 VWA domain-containing protein [Muribaculaceae bacterium]